jgi:transposase
MRETITMTSNDQRRAHTITRVVAGDMTVAEAALLLGLAERSIWRLRRRLLCAGVDGLVHGNRGRPSPRRLDDQLRARIVELVRDRFAGANDCHLSELLAEESGITISRQSLQRLLRAAGLASPRRRRPPRHRSRRDRMPQAGLLLQLDGSRHDWLEGRGPRLTLVGAVDDATGIVTAATFREQEDAAGYLLVLRETVRRHGVPVAVYRDRHSIFETSDRTLTLEEQLADVRTPTQFGRALAELGVGSIAAHSPQAKGRVERVWGTLQDRLVTELRLAGAADRAAAERVLGRYLVRHNRRFGVPPADERPAWRAGPRGAALERVCSLKYRRVVANDGTVRAGATILQLPPRPGGRGYAGRRVELHLRLDGRLVIWDGERELLTTPAPHDAHVLRALGHARPVLGHGAPSVGSSAKPSAGHPWRRIQPGSKLYRTKQSQATGLTGSPGS